jgi:hypothetical protein
MGKGIDETMHNLREDVIRWKTRLERLRDEGATTNIEQLELMIARAELILSNWDVREQ